MKPIIRFKVNRLHVLLGQNDSILDNIEKGLQKKRSFRLDRVSGLNIKSEYPQGDK